MNNLSLNYNNYIQDVNIYPNPSSQYINIEMPTFNNTISLFDISGKLIFNKSTSKSTFKLNIENFNSGLYILRIVDDFGVVNRKLIFK
jgi:hypothetical protein